MADAVAAGKIKAVGVSNYSAEQMRMAHAALARRGIPLASNQVEYSLLHRQPEVNGVLDTCRELGVTLIAYSAARRAARSPASTARGPGRPGCGGSCRISGGKGLEAVAPVVALLREIGSGYGNTPRRWRCAGSSRTVSSYRFQAPETAHSSRITRAHSRSTSQKTKSLPSSGQPRT